jgi:hypothetical protein
MAQVDGSITVGETNDWSGMRIKKAMRDILE